MTPAVTSFSYTTLEPVIARSARALAEQMRGFERRTTETAIEIGRELIALKAALGHGHFGAWLAAEFPAGERTARNFMSAAEAFGAKSACVSDLPASTVYRLAAPATPEAFRTEIVQRLEAGEQLDRHVVDKLTREAQRDAARARREKQRKASRAEAKDPATAAKRAKAWEREERKQEARRLAIETERRGAAEIIVGVLDDEKLTTLLGHLDAAQDWGIRGTIRALLKESGRLPSLWEEPR